MELRAMLWLVATLLIANVNAQFGFFDQMFGGQQQQQQHHQQQQNVRSDAAWYQSQYENAHCDKYLCPGTLSCVHFPHHCPCAWSSTEDKVELGDGIAICASKGGYQDGETIKKIELARKGLL
ncbi:Long chronological lifespan protein 2 [Kalmusia sp. IMI 367209]|nr:Long chronological lifespan protein 2 [Kalmusia sp. IMI 367209]